MAWLGSWEAMAARAACAEHAQSMLGRSAAYQNTEKYTPKAIEDDPKAKFALKTSSFVPTCSELLRSPHCVRGSSPMHTSCTRTPHSSHGALMSGGGSGRHLRSPRASRRPGRSSARRVSAGTASPVLQSARQGALAQVSSSTRSPSRKLSPQNPRAEYCRRGAAFGIFTCGAES